MSYLEVPTEGGPESDGTLVWDRTGVVLVELVAAGTAGLGYSYAGPGTAKVAETLREAVLGLDPMDVPEIAGKIGRRVRNVGRPGIASEAISAIDIAAWDLKSRILGVPLVALLGAERRGVVVYGSGGFTSSSIEELRDQLGEWVHQGIGLVKMKVGRDPRSDPERVREARDAIGPHTALMVDANGAFGAKRAVHMAEKFAEHGVVWFEEPVSSDDLEGLALVRHRAPACMDIAAGEYGYDTTYFRRMIQAGAVDVLQADATRCGGITGFLRIAALCDAWDMPLSAHTAPSAHLAACCSATRIAHVEWFHDHVRIERLIFDGVVTPRDGLLTPDRSRPGLGIELRRDVASRLAA